MNEYKVLWEGTLATGALWPIEFQARIVRNKDELVLLRVTQYGGEEVFPSQVHPAYWVKALVEAAQSKP